MIRAADSASADLGLASWRVGRLTCWLVDPYGPRAMPMEFLTDAQVAGYGRFDGVRSGSASRRRRSAFRSGSVEPPTFRAGYAGASGLRASAPITRRQPEGAGGGMTGLTAVSPAPFPACAGPRQRPGQALRAACG